MARSLKRRLFRWLGPRLYARMQAEYYLVRLRRALKRPAYAEKFFGRDLPLFAQRLGPGDVVLDIGAYLGGTAALFAKAVAPAGKAHAFEPYHGSYLTEIVRRLGLPDTIEIHNVALAAEKGTVTPSVPLHQGVPLYSQAGILKVTQDAGPGTAEAERMAGPPRAAPRADPLRVEQPSLRGKTVPMLRLDDFLAARGLSPLTIAAVKIDVEGSEPGVLRGGEKFFRDFRGPVLCEFWYDVMPPEGWSHLRSLGYHCRYLDSRGRFVPADTEAQLRDIARGGTYGNFWFEKDPA